MPRLNQKLWEKARADHEVIGMGLAAIAKKYGVTTAAAMKKARADGWEKAKSKALVDKKVLAIQQLAEVDIESSKLSLTSQFTFDAVVRERLQAEGLLANLDVVLASKGVQLAKAVASPEEWETMTRGRRNLSPKITPENSNQVFIAPQGGIGWSAVKCEDNAIKARIELEKIRKNREVLTTGEMYVNE